MKIHIIWWYTNNIHKINCLTIRWNKFILLSYPSSRVYLINSVSIRDFCNFIQLASHLPVVHVAICRSPRQRNGHQQWIIILIIKTNVTLRWTVTDDIPAAMHINRSLLLKFNYELRIYWLSGIASNKLSIERCLVATFRNWNN